MHDRKLEVIDPTNMPFAFSRGARFPPHFSRYALSLVESLMILIPIGLGSPSHDIIIKNLRKNNEQKIMNRKGEKSEKIENDPLYYLLATSS